MATLQKTENQAQVCSSPALIPAEARLKCLTCFRFSEQRALHCMTSEESLGRPTPLLDGVTPGPLQGASRKGHIHARYCQVRAKLRGMYEALFGTGLAHCVPRLVTCWRLAETKFSSSARSLRGGCKESVGGA